MTSWNLVASFPRYRLCESCPALEGPMTFNISLLRRSRASISALTYGNSRLEVCTSSSCSLTFRFATPQRSRMADQSGLKKNALSLSSRSESVEVVSSAPRFFTT